MKSFVLALAIAGVALAGCAAEEAETDVIVTEEAPVVTPAEDDLMVVEDTTVVMDGAVMEDTTVVVQ